MTRKGDGSCHASLLTGFDIYAMQGQHDAAQLRSPSAGAFLTNTSGSRMTLDNGICIVSV